MSQPTLTLHQVAEALRLEAKYYGLIGKKFDMKRWESLAESIDAHLAKESSPSPQASVADERRILWGVVANAGRLSKRARPRWAHVMDATGLGSTRSIELCKLFNFDPEKLVGGA